MALMLTKETKTYRVDTEEEAINLIQEYKDKAASYYVSKNGYTMKTKKSKGEITSVWYIAQIELTYEV